MINNYLVVAAAVVLLWLNDVSYLGVLGRCRRTSLNKSEMEVSVEKAAFSLSLSPVSLSLSLYLCVSLL